MKRLTAVTAILAGIAAVAGIFGMSEAATASTSEGSGFWLVTGLVLASAPPTLRSTSAASTGSELAGSRSGLS